MELEIFPRAARHFDAARFDIALYQVGNNGCHDFVYETALRHPGVVVMHESNLHHLMADLTIRRGDWDAYVRECEYQGGAAAREFAERVRKLEVGPDYEGLPMTRRLLESARGVIVHSEFMEAEVRRCRIHRTDSASSPTAPGSRKPTAMPTATSWGSTTSPRSSASSVTSSRISASPNRCAPSAACCGWRRRRA